MSARNQITQQKSKQNATTQEESKSTSMKQNFPILQKSFETGIGSKHLIESNSFCQQINCYSVQNKKEIQQNSDNRNLFENDKHSKGKRQQLNDYRQETFGNQEENKEGNLHQSKILNNVSFNQQSQFQNIERNLKSPQIKSEKIFGQSLNFNDKKNNNKIVTDIQIQNENKIKSINNELQQQQIMQKSFKNNGGIDLQKSIKVENRGKSEQVLNKFSLNNKNEFQKNNVRNQLWGFEVGRIIGSGMIGIVYLVRSIEEKQKLYILKEMNFKRVGEKKLFPSLKNEIDILCQVQGIQNVIELESVFCDGLSIGLLFKYYDNRDMYQYFRKNSQMNESLAKRLFKQILNAVKGVHNLGIVHRDIKPENILLDYDMNAYLADFGFAMKLTDPEFTKYHVVGTTEYYPYEMVMKHPYDQRADIWCLGILLYEFLFKTTPFQREKKEEIKENIKSLKFSFPGPDRKLREAKDLIRRILVEPEKRITINEIEQHIWLQDKRNGRFKLNEQQQCQSLVFID